MFYSFVNHLVIHTDLQSRKWKILLSFKPSLVQMMSPSCVLDSTVPKYSPLPGTRSDTRSPSLILVQINRGMLCRFFVMLFFE